MDQLAINTMLLIAASDGVTGSGPTKNETVVKRSTSFVGERVEFEFQGNVVFADSLELKTAKFALIAWFAPFTGRKRKQNFSVRVKTKERKVVLTILKEWAIKQKCDGATGASQLNFERNAKRQRRRRNQIPRNLCGTHNSRFLARPSNECRVHCRAHVGRWRPRAVGEGRWL